MFKQIATNTIVLLTLITIFYSINIKAQFHQESNIKFKLGQSYERSGDLETALKFYEESFAKDSSNVVIFEALKRTYLQLKQYDNAIHLMEYWLSFNPDDISLLAQLGSAYVLNSNESKAYQLWDQAVAIAPRNEATYRIVCGAIVQSRLFDRAIEIYKRGRIACNNPTLFTTEIANLYSITLNYAEATREYLNMIRQNPTQLGLVQSYISQYISRADGLKATTQIVNDAINSEPDNIQLHYMLAWLYMEGNNFEQAFNIYKQLDEKLKSGGKELFNFANRALKEKSFITATKAYQYISEKYPNFELMPQVKFGYAKCLENEYEGSDTLKLFGTRNPFTTITQDKLNERYSKVLSAYEVVLSTFPTTETAALALYHIAEIKYEKLMDLNGARLALETIQNKYTRHRTIQIESQLKLADVYLALGNIENAKDKYKQISETPSVPSTIREKALYRLAEVDYLQLNFKEALAKLENLTLNPTSDITNDALSLKIFIQENLQFEDALKQFARAEFLKKQNKYSEALEYFNTIIKKYPDTEVVDEAIINIGDIQTQLALYQDALTTYNNLVLNYPTSIFVDRTLMKIGLLYQFGLNNIQKAIETYQQILEKYPTSVFVIEARKNIRQLRGDNIL